MTTRTGQCLCGRVRYELRGEPSRVGICHCADCRKESGSVFSAFAIWPREAFSSNGDVIVHEDRSFCPACGSRLFNLTDEKAEIRIGSLDTPPIDPVPTYEVWVKRREPWVARLPGNEHYVED